MRDIVSDMRRGFSDFEFEVVEAQHVSDTQRDELLHLFEANYREADPSFLHKSLGTLRHLAIARRQGQAVGFGMAESRVIELPRLGDQAVTLAGLCCIDPDFRRLGLFGELERIAAAASELPQPDRRLLCGRMAHPAAFRQLGRIPGVLPVAGSSPTPWQQEVGSVIAQIYGVHDFDPATFVCIGDGRPIGYPRIEFKVDPHEWQIFESVDRSRGDALLAMAWLPSDPPGW
ncbi:MAG: hypothetical protein JRE70_07250 [Deltaproteobacteria bacterium]|jgi:hypothetical protein|nr:hypothetical protein [Deltaproteobacteria bacterium]